MEIKVKLYKARRSAAICASTACFICCCQAIASEQVDSVMVLSEVEVVARKPATAVTDIDGAVALTDEALTKVPQYFGSPDMLRYLQLTSGVTTISDYSSGVTIDGMDYSQNTYRLSGVPVQFPYHFGGIFSTFNSDHYPSLVMTRSIHHAGSYDCLGGIIDVSPSVKDFSGFKGEVNVGMLASQAHLAWKPLSSMRIDVSGRVSYIDALYHHLISTNNTDVRYNLHDVDAGVSYDLGASGWLQGVVHHNADKLIYGDNNYAMSNYLRWSNTLAGVSWQNSAVMASAYYSDMHSELLVVMEQFDLRVPAAIREYGTSARWSKNGSGYNFYCGATFDGTHCKPQWVKKAGIDSETDNVGIAEDAHLLKVFGEAEISACDKALRLTCGLDVNYYSGVGGYHTVNPTPRLTASWRHRSGGLSLHVGNLRQYIHYSGFSDIGMASNYKFPASASCPAQNAWNFVVTASQRLPWGIYADCELYYKILANQPEYVGSVLDLLDKDYKASDHILVCEGYNFGGNISLRRSYGDFTAMANYAYGVARRRNAAEGYYFTASSEIRHCFNATMAYDINSRWSVNAAFSLASGRPVTPIKALYMIAESVMMEYGERNSSRLPLRHRLDLGAAYAFDSGNGRLQHKVALSLINAYGHRNVEISSYRFDAETFTYSRRLKYSLYRFLPSLSYLIRF